MPPVNSGFKTLSAPQPPALASLWHEIEQGTGEPSPIYAPLWQRLDKMKPRELHRMQDRLEATMREMGVTFDISRDRPWGRKPWHCDLSPQIFSHLEWKHLETGLRQRLRAFEALLQDVYGKKEILRDRILPVRLVLGSPYFQKSAQNLPTPGQCFLHISGLSLGRSREGTMQIKHHYFSNASGISYMMQNRRALARVLPGYFEDYAIQSITETPVRMLEALQSLASNPASANVVLLSSGEGSAVYSEHSFLARRMGIPLVRGGDLLVLQDQVFLKTITGLMRVDVIYSRLSDEWIDPLIFRPDSLIGVSGLVHCIRKGSVAVVNAIGSQLGDDRALLHFAPQIIRYYLGESPLLPTIKTYWLGDPDQYEFVKARWSEFVLRPLYGERILMSGGIGLPDWERIVAENPAGYVAQSLEGEALTTCFEEGFARPRRQDHIVFAVRGHHGNYHISPGGLTRVSTKDNPFTASELGGGSKDTWVLAPAHEAEVALETHWLTESKNPAQHVTSRVAEAFYWLGRYLERAQSLGNMISLVESLEAEELNQTERALYRPVWNTLLPPLEKGDKKEQRNLANTLGRYRLALDVQESGSLASNIQRIGLNADSIFECLSVEAWSVIDQLRQLYQTTSYRPRLSDARKALAIRAVCEATIHHVPSFFGTAENTMIADGGWHFCEIGKYLERAALTAHALASITQARVRNRLNRTTASEHAREIQLSVFLRLLNCRDVYRRVYQMRVESGCVLELLYSSAIAPRSVLFCLKQCEHLLGLINPLQPDMAAQAQRKIQDILALIHRTDWEKIARLLDQNAPLTVNPITEIAQLIYPLHDWIADTFLNHQIVIHQPEQTQFLGL